MKKGFTILELLVVVAIIAILAVIALPNFIGRIEEAKDSQELAEINAVEKAIATYYAENGVYPTLQGKDGSLVQSQPLDGAPHNIDFSSVVPNYLASLPHFSYWWVDYRGEVYHTEKAIGALSGGVFTPTAGYTYTVYKTNGTTQVLSAPYTLQAGEYILGKDELGGELPKLGASFKNAKMHPEDPEFVVIPTLPLNTAYTFTNANAVGRTGPTQAQITSAYTGTSLAGLVTVPTQGYQLFTVPATGTYKIEAYGAQGGNYLSFLGGSGAIMKGNFALTEGQQLLILVGQVAPDTGVATHGGGGGGTYVTLGSSYAASTPLIVAGGGGGSYGGGTYPSGLNAVVTNNADNISVPTYGIFLGGVGGGGGQSYAQLMNSPTSGTGSGGGGFYSNGFTGTGWANDVTGYAFRNGALGGYANAVSTVQNGMGGFGGGGGSHTGTNSAGGGGGYSGGTTACYNYSAGGGGSYNIGTNQTNSVGNTGHGKVIITYIGQ